MVGFNNILDYQTNFYFLSHVAGMNDLISGTANTWRAVRNPLILHGMYLVVIGCECTSGLLIIRGAINMSFSPANSTEVKVHPSLLNGLLIAIFLWFFIFVCIAGEWFLMWQSDQYNAQATAFALTLIYLLFYLIFTSGKT
jgi:predicted small integral membrane protein